MIIPLIYEVLGVPSIVENAGEASMEKIGLQIRTKQTIIAPGSIARTLLDVWLG